MCPICWTTALASFAVLIIVSALATVGTDKWCLRLIALLLLLITLRSIGLIQAAWWCFVPAITATTLRAAWLMATNSDQFVVTRLWKKAVSIAGRQCRRQLDHESSSG